MAAPLRKMCLSGRALIGVNQTTRRTLMLSSARPGPDDQSPGPDDQKDAATQSFDAKMLDYIVCPLSKKPLRFNKETCELICDDLGVAYPIINGIPNLTPEDSRKL